MINLHQKTKKVKEKNTFNSVNPLYEGRELTLNAFKSGISPINATQEKRSKILTPKKKLQDLPIALPQVKSGNTSESLLNKIRQIIYIFCTEQNKVLKKYITIS